MLGAGGRASGGKIMLRFLTRAQVEMMIPITSIGDTETRAHFRESWGFLVQTFCYQSVKRSRHEVMTCRQTV